MDVTQDLICITSRCIYSKPLMTGLHWNALFCDDKIVEKNHSSSYKF